MTSGVESYTAAPPFTVLATARENTRKEEMTVKGIVMKRKDGKLLVEVDLTKDYGLSSTKKNLIVATTGGNVPVEGDPDIKIGINVFKPLEEKAS